MKYLFFILYYFSFLTLTVAQKAPENDLIIFVNGFWGKQKFSPAQCNLACYWQYDSIQFKPKNLWNYNQHQVYLFFEEAYAYFGTKNIFFVDGGRFTPFNKAKKRQKKGKQFVDNQIDNLINQNIISSNTIVHFVTHSMGGAYAEGMIQALISRKIRVGKVLHISPSEAADIKTNRNEFGPEKRIQIISQSDGTVQFVNRWHRYSKDNLIREMNDLDLFACFFESDITRPQAGDIGHALHMRKIAFDIIKDLERISFCGDERCIILENISNKIPYRKVCKGAFCAFYDRKKGYFIQLNNSHN